MSAKTEKKERRRIRKVKRELCDEMNERPAVTTDDLVEALRTQPLRLRIHIAVYMLTGLFPLRKVSDGADTRG